MDTEMQRPEGTSPTASEMNALLDRLLDEVEMGMADGAPPADVPAVGTVPTVPPPSPAAGGNSLGALLTNPSLLTALPTLAENLAPLLGSLSGGGVGSAKSATRPRTVDRHTALLCAVKPYLSPRRQEAAETVIRLCRVWDALERSGISLSGVLAGLDKVIPTGQSSSTGRDKEVT
jgi:hypothetical protein